MKALHPIPRIIEIAVATMGVVVVLTFLRILTIVYLLDTNTHDHNAFFTNPALYLIALAVVLYLKRSLLQKLIDQSQNTRKRPWQEVIYFLLIFLGIIGSGIFIFLIFLEISWSNSTF